MMQQQSPRPMMAQQMQQQQQQQQQQPQGMMQQQSPRPMMAQQMQQRMVQPQQMQQQMVQPQQMQQMQQQRMQMQHPVSQMGNQQMMQQQQGPMMSQQMQQQHLQQQRMQHEQLRQQQLQHMQMQRMQHGGQGFEPPQQVVGAQATRMPMGGQFVPHMAGGPRPMGAMQQMMNQVSQPMIRQQMGVGGRMPGMPGHPAVTAGLRLTIPQQQMGPGAPGTPNSTLPSPALTPRSEHDDMDTRSSGAHTPGSDKMDGSITPDMNDPNKALKRRPSAQMPGQKRRISANDVVGAKKRPRKGSRVDDGDYDNYIDTVMHQLKNLPPMSTVEPKLSHSFNACGVYGIGDVPKLMSKDIDIHSGPLEGKFGNSSLSTEGDYYSTMPFGPEPPVPYIPPVSCSQRGFYQQEFMPDIRPEAPGMDGYISPDLFYSSSPEPDAEEERISKKKRKERRKAAMIKEKVDAKKLAEDRKEKEEAEKENKDKTEAKDGSDTKEAKETDDEKDQAEISEKKESSDKKEESEKKETSIEKDTDKTSLEKENMEAEKETKVEDEEEEEEECISPFLDLWPDDSDDEPAVVEPPPPPQISSRPPSPELQLLRPIPIKPKPGQTITLSDVTNLDKKREDKESVKKLDARLGLLSLAGSLGITPNP